MNSDGFTRLKYIAYCRSQMPPEEVGSDYADFVAFAKHFLCSKTNRLFKDPIWDKYTDEEVIVEYFSYQFSDPHNGEKTRIEFEKELLKGREDIDDWLVSQSKKNEPVELEDKIEFSPDSIGE